MDATCCRYVYHLILLATSWYAIKGDDLCINHDKPGNLELSCPEPNGVIAEVGVLAGKGHCKSQEAQCYGESAFLLVDVHSCFWSNNCTVRFPTDPIIRVPADAQDYSNSCFGESSEFMRFDVLRCFTPRGGGSAILIDICKPGDKTGFSPDSGLIRSHVHYPWLYQPDVESCAIELYRQKNKQLLVTVLDLELDEDDSLRLTSMDLNKDIKENVTLTSSSSLTVRDVQVTIKFTIGSYSNGGRGFLVCFAFVGESDHVNDACEYVLTKGGARSTIMVAEEPQKKICKNKRGKEKPCREKRKNRKRKGDGKKRKNRKERKNKKNKKQRREKSTT